jgi:hypothetical protein
MAYQQDNRFLLRVSSPPNLPFLRGGYKLVLWILAGNCPSVVPLLRPISSEKITLLLCLHPTAAAKNYSVTLSLRTSSKSAANLQQQKKYSVTLSLNPSSKPAARQQQLEKHALTLSLASSCPAGAISFNC